MDNQEKEEKVAKNTQTAQNEAQENAPKTEDGQTQESEQKPKTVHCFRCKMPVKENESRCPFCGFKRYVPMDEEKRDKFKLIATVVGIVVFIILFVILQFKK